MMVLYKRKEECCGCFACYSVCPREAIIMQDDEEGFAYPIIDNDLCVDCGLCSKVCPIKNVIKN
ncbi:4Fe-4S binding protein [Butyrivibrio sp. WCD2001]|uniref:4Fe-4S binding protein n=1 Tax=Butyrivibrio sp. WCD2001 TaxID=1280681 RepID=UPI0005D26EA1|nr:4Fe-4S binding protein [Butyrivibrio sp. WCD2001]